MELKDRFRKARQDRGLSQAKLAEIVGISQSAIQYIENGRNQGSTRITELAAALGVSPDWLLSGVGDPGKPLLSRNVAKLTSNAGQAVPVISWVAAGSFESVELIPEDDLLKWVPCPVPHSENTFALKVVGISMENPNGRPSFEDGDIIYVDPEREPENKSLVIVTLDGSSQATFKQLIIELDGKYIQPLNPNWHERIIKINGNATINGVVIGKWTDIN